MLTHWYDNFIGRLFFSWKNIFLRILFIILFVLLCIPIIWIWVGFFILDIISLIFGIQQDIPEVKFLPLSEEIGYCINKGLGERKFKGWKYWNSYGKFIDEIMIKALIPFEKEIIKADKVVKKLNEIETNLNGLYTSRRLDPKAKDCLACLKNKIPYYETHKAEIVRTFYQGRMMVAQQVQAGAQVGMAVGMLAR